MLFRNNHINPLITSWFISYIHIIIENAKAKSKLLDQTKVFDTAVPDVPTLSYLKFQIFWIVLLFV